LFVDVKGLYRDASKLKIVGEIMEDLITSLENEKLHDDGMWDLSAKCMPEPSDSIPPPTTLLWAYYFLALHIAHPLNPSSDYERALSLLSKALDHTPTLPEILMAKAKVLKRAGDPQGAAHAMEEARLLDLQDRFLNGKAAKYWLRAGDVAKAEELLAMFTKVSLGLTVYHLIRH
jgi:tetratricopeptide (TPR) repeat protein